MITSNLTVNFRCCLFLPLIFFSFNSPGQIELNNRYLDNYNDFFPHSIFSHFTHNDTIVFIYPDSISNTGLANELDEFVNQFSNHNIVLIGEEAIGNELGRRKNTSENSDEETSLENESENILS